ncbi:LysR family transcriptional regulator [Pantoea stewartii]|uniref:LysR family transcriptional regulator n=1 Tax=Pantoea stewartii TaxID=66269 RepID=UPI00249E7ED9|nr:LysR family transcriptional regulator [Pantoea stewartii]
MDSLTSLTSFVRTAETLSFVQAARLLGISASAVGKNVARLEHKLGVRLFNRSTRKVSLTSEGAALLVRCKQILEQLQEAESELANSAAEPTGKLRVSLPVAGYRLLLPALSAFNLRYPQVEMDLDFSDRLVNIIDEGFDVVIRSGELADSRLTARKLGEFRFTLCASPGYLEANGVPESPAELTSHRCIVFRLPSTGLLQPWELHGLKSGATLSAGSVLTVNNIEAAIGLTLSGTGISYLPDFIVREALAGGQLKEVMQGYCTKQGYFSAVWPSGRYLSPRVRYFIDFITESGLSV